MLSLSVCKLQGLKAQRGMKGDSGQKGDLVSSLKYLQKLWPSKQHFLFRARCTLFSDQKKKKTET